MTQLPLSADLIAETNARHEALEEDYGALGRKLARSGIDIAAVQDRVAGFSVAVPSWGAGRGGTRFAKFPIAGEPTNIHEKLEDCAVINQLAGDAARFAAFPVGQGERLCALREEAASLGLGWDAVNSNTFQDQVGQAHTYANGSLPRRMRPRASRRWTTTSNASRSAAAWLHRPDGVGG
jgi:L-rhamnose isomerase/sugar isomerase